MPHDDIETKLARIGRRLQAQRDEVRSRLQAEPGLLELAEIAREVFAAKLIHVRIGAWSHGTEPAEGTVIAIRDRPAEARSSGDRVAPQRKSPRSGRAGRRGRLRQES